MIIGSFKLIGPDAFVGEIRTLSVHRRVRLDGVSNPSKKGAPDYEVSIAGEFGPVIIGAAWGRPDRYASKIRVVLDDPFLARPIQCLLCAAVPTDNDYYLSWSRPENRKRPA